MHNHYCYLMIIFKHRRRRRKLKSQINRSMCSLYIVDYRSKVALTNIDVESIIRHPRMSLKPFRNNIVHRGVGNLSTSNFCRDMSALQCCTVAYLDLPSRQDYARLRYVYTVVVN